MGDRLLEDLEIALSSYSKHDIDDYNEEEMEDDYEEEDEEVNELEIDEKSDEFACPFCPEDFDVLELCCHIDADHRMEVKPRICPICSLKVGINMASHVITQHEKILKGLCNKKHFNPRSRSSMFHLRKELREKHLLLIKESPSVGFSFSPAADSMLLSFVNSPQPTNRQPQKIEPASSSEASSTGENSCKDSSERIQPSLSTARENEKSRRCEFLQGLLLSTILDDL